MVIFIAIWILCAILSWGGMFALLQGFRPDTAESEYVGDLIVSAAFGAVFGPAGLVGTVLVTKGFSYGFRWW